MHLLSPKNDVVFQKLFGRNENKDVLISFLNSIITKSDNEKIIDVCIEEKKLDVSMIIDEKISILDIYVTTNLGTHINVEMQIINEYNMIKRTLFYWAKMFLKQLTKGQDYSKLEKTITINLVDFNFLQDEKFHNFYHLYESESKKRLTDIIEIHFIELKKFSESNNSYNTQLDRWLEFINDPNGEESRKMALMDSDIGRAKEVLSFISSDNDVKRLAEMREKALLDEMSRLNGAREEGIKEGKKEGIKEGIEKRNIELAKNLLDILDDETISLKTGLEIDVVKKLRDEI